MTFTLENTPRSGAGDARCRNAHVLLAHGAGAGIETPFLQSIAEHVAARGVHVVRFEFAYMASRREGGKKRPPPRAEALIEEYARVLDSVSERLGPDAQLYIGGKSLGGRVASLLADDAFRAGRIAGLVCLGYPFHPPGKPEKLRTAHLKTMTCPALILQGTRDPFGTKDEVAGMELSANCRVTWLEDGDHDLKPRRASGWTHGDHIEAAADAIAAFIGVAAARR